MLLYFPIIKPNSVIKSKRCYMWGRLLKRTICVTGLRSYKLKLLVKLVVQLCQLCIDLDHIFSRISKEISTREERNE